MSPSWAGKEIIMGIANLAGVYKASPIAAPTGGITEVLTDSYGNLKMGAVDSSGNANSSSFPLYVAQSDGVVSNASVTSATTVFSIDTTYYQNLAFQFSSVGSGNTFTLEASIDNATWATVLLDKIENASVSLSTTWSPATSNMWSVPIWYRYYRVRVTVYGSGTVTVYYLLKSSPTQRQSITLRQGGSYALGNGYAFGAIGVTQAGGNVTRARIQSAASTNATSVKASAGQVHCIYAANNAATIAFLKLYNKASAPTVGTDVPVVTIPLPANGGAVVIEMNVPDIYATGIAYSIHGATGAADSDATACAANQVTGMILYG
jgi:hypothetical protein